MIRNWRNSCRVLVRHKPTGIEATASASKWQRTNRHTALSLMRSRVAMARREDPGLVRDWTPFYKPGCQALGDYAVNVLGHCPACFETGWVGGYLEPRKACPECYPPSAAAGCGLGVGS